MKIIANQYTYIRYSLVAVWLWTGVASLLEWHGESTALLQAAGIANTQVQGWLIAGGAAVDIALGLWLLQGGRWACAAAMAGMAVMTITATVLLPALWLHPLGPLSKNLPIAAALYLLWQSSKPRCKV